jgi:hypothetical protein
LVLNSWKINIKPIDFINLVELERFNKLKKRQEIITGKTRKITENAAFTRADPLSRLSSSVAASAAAASAVKLKYKYIPERQKENNKINYTEGNDFTDEIGWKKISEFNLSKFDKFLFK